MRRDGGGALGVMAPERARSIVVLSLDGELSVTLREDVAREYAVVRDARPAEAEAVMRACLPWPWMVVGSTPALDAAAVRSIASRPALVLWLGVPPSGLPAHTRTFTRYRDLAASVDAGLRAEVAGMRLAVSQGVRLPDGALAATAGLEALVASFPRPIDAPMASFRGCAEVLRRHHVAVRPGRSPEGGVALRAEAAPS